RYQRPSAFELARSLLRTARGQLSGSDQQPRCASRRRAEFPARCARAAGVCPARDAGGGRRSANGQQGHGGLVTHRFPIAPPIEPMLAKLATEIPVGDGFLFEPKWDGFRAIVFRGGGEVFIQSRDLKPLDRYFPELHDALRAGLPDGSVLDGEIVIATPRGLDFDALQMRLHPAASRVAKLAQETPAAFVAFDAIAADGEDLRDQAQRERRARLERLLAHIAPPIHLTPMTRDRAQAS